MPFPNTKKGRARKKRYQRSIKNKRQYEALRRKGHSKSSAARISNAHAQGKSRRKQIARKAARTRKRRGR
jgi:hypothetical protein